MRNRRRQRLESAEIRPAACTVAELRMSARMIKDSSAPAEANHCGSRKSLDESAVSQYFPRSSDASAAPAAAAGGGNRPRRRCDRLSNGLDVRARLSHRRQDRRSIAFVRFGVSTKLHHFTLVCRDLSELSIYARVDNASYRILKHYTPGAVHVSAAGVARSAAAARPPETPHASAFAFRITRSRRVCSRRLANRSMSTSLILPDATEALAEPEDISRRARTAGRSDRRRRRVRLHRDDRRRPDRNAARRSCARTRRVRVIAAAPPR